jgi:hypothetical protein
VAKHVVIFGRSPFIHSVDVERLTARHVSIGFNSFGDSFSVDHLFYYDDWYGFGRDPKTLIHVPSWFKQADNRIVRYQPRPYERPIRRLLFDQGCRVLSFRYFTASVALNWAILNNFGKIYLVGIDHREDEQHLAHFDAPASKMKTTARAHQAFKQYVYHCQGAGVEIFQCNPDVAEQWQLPFKQVESLY